MKIRSVDHISYAVADIDATIEAWSQAVRDRPLDVSGKRRHGCKGTPA